MIAFYLAMLLHKKYAKRGNKVLAFKLLNKRCNSHKILNNIRLCSLWLPG